MNDEEKVREQPLRVLFVDDEENIVRSLRRLFIEEEFEVLTATSGEEGLEIINGHDDIGVIMSDQRMPGLSGVEFLEQARKLAPEAVRIVLTGYADIEAAMGAINRGGAYRYLSKPWVDEDLVQNIREAVKLFSLRRENRRLGRIVQEQNRTLKEWNSRLKNKVLEQTHDIIERNETLSHLNKQLKNSLHNSIASFSNLMELRDKSSGSHAQYVAELSGRIAVGLGLPAKEVETIRTAALLHDIGKIGIGEELFRKNISDMTSAEQEEYQSHAVRGQAAIDSAEDLREAGECIRHHHEWYNGAGWPDRLCGDAIPPGARIIALADYVDRLMTHSPSQETITLVLKKAGHKSGPDGRFDPALLSLLKAHIKGVYGDSRENSEKIEVQVESNNLQSGMVLARKVASGTGILLLNKNSVLNDNNIKSLRRYFVLDPPREKIYVWQ